MSISNVMAVVWFQLLEIDTNALFALTLICAPLAKRRKSTLPHMLFSNSRNLLVEISTME
jgi:hypothetical protein